MSIPEDDAMRRIAADSLSTRARSKRLAAATKSLDDEIGLRWNPTEIAAKARDLRSRIRLPRHGINCFNRSQRIFRSS
jgi:hypothetical protein